MKNNTYFEELNQIACTFEKAHEAHKALKQQIIDEYEARTKALREELEAARRELADKDKTLESLRNTNKFLLDELGKQR